MPYKDKHDRVIAPAKVLENAKRRRGNQRDMPSMYSDTVTGKTP